MKKILARFVMNQSGQALPVAIIVLVVGTLMVLPMLNYVSTSLKKGEIIETNVDAIYAAESGIEDGIWQLQNPVWPDFPFSYTLRDASNNPLIINGMTVNVTIDDPMLLMGQAVEDPAVHEKWLRITKTRTTTDNGTHAIHEISINMSDWYSNKQIKIERIRVLISGRGLTYIAGSSTSEVYGDPKQCNVPNGPMPDPQIGGDPSRSILLTWDIEALYGQPWTIQIDNDAQPADIIVTFRLSDPLPQESLRMYTVVSVQSQDIGDITDMNPVVVIAEARRPDTGRLEARVEAGMWVLSDTIEISKWEVIP